MCGVAQQKDSDESVWRLPGFLIMRLQSSTRGTITYFNTPNVLSIQVFDLCITVPLVHEMG
jgi:hypothetical protein